jgi:hypothetical protein
MTKSSISGTTTMTTAETKRKSGKPRKPARLTAELERLAAAYGVAAAAAGVSLAAMTASADAEIVYTPTNTPVNGVVVLDLNHDGIGDFRLTNFARVLERGQASGRFWVGCEPRKQSYGPCNYPTNQVWGKGMLSGRFAYALPAGSEVRPSKAFFQHAQSSSNYYGAVMGALGYASYGESSGTSGQWLYAKNRYLGLQFVINGQVHYGWARLSAAPIKGKYGAIEVLLTGYAYETVPGKPIITGKTKGPDVVTLPLVKLESATLGQLARGASQMRVWRNPTTHVRPDGNPH